MAAPMNVQVSGKHVNVGDALRQRITDGVIGGIGKYFERGGDADVSVARTGTAFASTSSCIWRRVSNWRRGARAATPTPPSTKP